MWASVGVLVAVVLVVVVAHPLWQDLNLHLPGEPSTKVDFTTPVDTLFYVRNANEGYSWGEFKPTSLWFHPLVTWLIRLLPSEVPAKWGVYAVSLVSAVVALCLVESYARRVFDLSPNPRYLVLAVLVPGGLNMGVGNAEMTSLAFNALLMIAVLGEGPPVLAFVSGILAILSKPNAIYLVLPLVAYGAYGLAKHDGELNRRCLLGLLGIFVGWASWILYVDLQMGEFGSYWRAREASMVSLEMGAMTLMYRATQVVLSGDLGLMMKFLTAFTIPVVDLWLLVLAPFRREIDRLSAALAVGSMLVITLLTNNPNKIIVYVLTVPAHIPIYLMAFRQSREKVCHFRGLSMSQRALVTSGLVSLLVFCIGMVVIFVIGTPLGWYY